MDGAGREVNFRLPGPTPLPPPVLEAMQRPMIPHRGPAAMVKVTSLKSVVGPNSTDAFETEIWVIYTAHSRGARRVATLTIITT